MQINQKDPSCFLRSAAASREALGTRDKPATVRATQVRAYDDRAKALS